MKLGNDILNNLLLEGYLTEDQALDAYEEFLLNEDSKLFKEEIMFTAKLAEEIIKMNDDELTYLIVESMIPEFGEEETTEILEDVIYLLESLGSDGGKMLLEATLGSIKRSVRSANGYRAGDARKARRSLKTAHKNWIAQGGTPESDEALEAAKKEVQRQNILQSGSSRKAARLARAASLGEYDKKVADAKTNLYGKYNWWQRHFSREGISAKKDFKRIQAERKLERKFGSNAEKKMAADNKAKLNALNPQKNTKEKNKKETKEVKMPVPGDVLKNNPGVGSKVEIEPAPAQKPVEPAPAPKKTPDKVKYVASLDDSLPANQK